MYFDPGFPFFVSDNKLLESCIARDLCHPASCSLLEHTDKLVQPNSRIGTGSSSRTAADAR